MGNAIYLNALWFLTVITTNVLQYEDVGNLTLAVSVASVVYTVQMYGVRNFQSSDVTYQYSPEDYLHMRYITIALGWLVAGIICAVLGYSQTVILAVSFYVLILTADSFSDVLYGDIQRAGRLEVAGYSIVARGIVILLTFTLAILKFRNLNTALACAAAGALLYSAAVDLYFHRKITPKCASHSLNYAFGILKACFPLFIAALIAALNSNFPRVVLERCNGAETLGYYGNISTAFMLVTTFTTALLVAFLPKYGHAVKNNDFREMYRIWLKQ